MEDQRDERETRADEEAAASRQETQAPRHPAMPDIKLPHPDNVRRIEAAAITLLDEVEAMLRAAGVDGDTDDKTFKLNILIETMEAAYKAHARRYMEVIEAIQTDNPNVMAPIRDASIFIGKMIAECCDSPYGAHLGRDAAIQGIAAGIRHFGDARRSIDPAATGASVN